MVLCRGLLRSLVLMYHTVRLSSVEFARIRVQVVDAALFLRGGRADLEADGPLVHLRVKVG